MLPPSAPNVLKQPPNSVLKAILSSTNTVLFRTTTIASAKPRSTKLKSTSFSSMAIYTLKTS
ncbi:hypothetical protein Scep_028259 [Stephania cephalantha]|uniref:Uncharacterized protein n=1 Tax=Stephania cephalantha TaxID=152367 RepID=A0AAP0EE68_9MAGN